MMIFVVWIWNEKEKKNEIEMNVFLTKMKTMSYFLDDGALFRLDEVIC